MPRPPRRDAAGFTLTELLLVLAVLVIVAGMAVPVSMDVTEQMRLGNSVRELERELQTARLRAVSLNEVLRVRLACPAALQYRTVQMMGTAIDGAANRCSEAAYPFPPAIDANPATPDADGPVRLIPPGNVLTGLGDGGALTALEFAPDGQVREVSGGQAHNIGVAGVTLTMTRGTHAQTVNINGLGRIRVQ